MDTKEKKCKNCRYYLKDFGYSISNGFYPREHGECTFFLGKNILKKCNQSCENYEERATNFDFKILENKIAANELIDVRNKIEHIIFIAQNQEKI